MTFDIESPQQDREKHRDEAVALRENQKYEEAIKKFEEIIEWDKQHENIRGQVDVIGHIRIVYMNWALNTEDPDTRKKYVQKAEELAEEAVKLAEKHLSDNKGAIAIAQAHLADVYIELLRYGYAKNPEELKVQCLGLINESLKNLTGSESHKAWLYNKLAQIQYLSGKVEAAFQAITDGEVALAKGERDEKKERDGVMKLKIWQSGLWLTQAYIYSKENAPELALMYAQAVLSLEDPDGTLSTRKAQAKRLISEVKK